MSKERDEPKLPASSPYLEPYREAVERFGPSFEATLWNSRKWQEARFRVMCEMAPFVGQVVLDAGAGQGDFARFMTAQGIAYGRYVGLEGVEEMARSAGELAIPKSEFYAADFVADERAFMRFTKKPADVIVFSGSLNTLDTDGALRVLGRAFEACSEAVVFNFLSDRHRKKEAPTDRGPAQRLDTLRVIEWALSRTPRVAFRQDYIPEGHDATVAMFH